ncbi:MAG: UDP-glucose 6-dehydrogenase, partial [Calditrichales bacterium]|nr:UDP-glucose 6-dehydrogenase [Calditrichales bacterium]
VNNNQKTILMDKIKKYFNGELKGKIFAIWGLAFKANTDDMREAPATSMINALIAEGAKVNGHDPEALKEANRRLKNHVDNNNLILSKKRYDALEGADALIILTEWNEFREPDFYLIKETLKSAAIFDGRNLYNPERMKKFGIDYFSVGRI